MSSARIFQEQLLAVIQQGFPSSLPRALHTAYMETPRHYFVPRYRLVHSAVWHDVDIHRPEQHLSVLYQDQPLILDSEGAAVRSTISQPSLVMRMLDMLRLSPGQRVLEIGTASGWNAALLGRLVGSTGRVYSVEIIPHLADKARQALAALPLHNVTVITGDGGFGYAAGAPYDRVVFTVGSYDIPLALHEQVADGGFLLMVLKQRGGGDMLYLFQKRGSCFESIESLPCGFVSMTGAYQMPNMEPILAEELPYWADIKDCIVARRPFWWGGHKASGAHAFSWKTMGFRAFLSIVAPSSYEVFAVGDKRNPSDIYFGLCDHAAQSVTIAGNDQITTYGSPVSGTAFQRAILQWVELGMPGGANFKLRAYPALQPIALASNQWLIRRRDTQYLWELSSSF